MKKDKRTNNDLRSIHIKLIIKKNYIIDIFDMYIIDMTYHRVCN
jgi:hypothetical protein